MQTSEQRPAPLRFNIKVICTPHSDWNIKQVGQIERNAVGERIVSRCEKNYIWCKRPRPIFKRTRLPFPEAPHGIPQKIDHRGILKEQQKNRGEIDVKITSILGIIKSPYLLSESLCARMFELGNSMKKLKLPKTIAKDFFTELASADRCVCDRCIGERERTAMITRNGDGPYDLDYNLLIMKAEERYWNDLRLLKETVRNALNRAERREFFSDAQDSTSCLTALLHFKDTPNVEFSFDVAITTKNKNGNYMRLIHNKNVYALGLDQYTWNEVPNSHQVKDRADKLKRAGLWQKVRDRYLEKKNMYLFRQDHNHPSFVVYVEAVNEVYSRYFNRGGGYSVQSIF